MWQNDVEKQPVNAPINDKPKYQQPTTELEYLRQISSVIKFGVQGFDGKNPDYPPQGLVKTNQLLDQMGAMISRFIEEQKKFNSLVLEYLRAKAHG